MPSQASRGTPNGHTKKTDESQPAKTALDAVLQGTGRIETLVNELLLFSKDEEYRMEAVDLASITREAVQNGLPSWDGHVNIHVVDGTLVKPTARSSIERW
jgi:signal transduction histidine kinase